MQLTVKNFKFFLDQYPDDAIVYLLGHDEFGCYHIDKVYAKYDEKDNILSIEGDLET